MKPFLLPRVEAETEARAAMALALPLARRKVSPPPILLDIPQLYPKQDAAVNDAARYSVIEASTKSGKTLGCLRWLGERAIVSPPHRNHWWVAPVYAQARIAYRRMRLFLRPEDHEANESEMRITLRGGAHITFKSGDNPDTLFGEDVFAAVVDEASRVKEDAWYAIRTTLTATRGPVRIIGNVKGKRNWFWRMARRAEMGEPDMAYHRIIAADAVAAGVLTAEEIEDARRRLPENVFRELYLAEASDDEGNPFGVAAIEACVASLSEAPPVIWSWDLAKSIDYTVGIALDIQGQVCRFERWQRPWMETITGIRAATGGVLTLVDSTGVGDPVLEMLQRGGGRYEGFVFTSRSKQQLMEGLAVAIQQGAVRFPDGPIVAELEAFEYSYYSGGVRYSAPEGMHDDCVCALALAVMAYNQHRVVLPERIIYYDPVSISRF